MKKLFSLIKKTGDKAIILDENGEPSFVIMPFSDYEKMVSDDDFSPDDFLAEIGRNDDDWRNWWEDKDQDLPFGQADFPADLTENGRNKPDWTEGAGSDFGSPAEPENPISSEDFSQNKEKNEEDPLYFETVE
ncbi:MAG: hypothetical protein AAB358_02070 [Patescibacteria group bacterium]